MLISLLLSLTLSSTPAHAGLIERVAASGTLSTPEVEMLIADRDHIDDAANDARGNGRYTLGERLQVLRMRRALHIKIRALANNMQ